MRRITEAVATFGTGARRARKSRPAPTHMSATGMAAPPSKLQRVADGAEIANAGEVGDNPGSAAKDQRIGDDLIEHGAHRCGLRRCPSATARSRR